MAVTMDQPLVSVIMITYGHEKYIKQAILGVLEQVASFPIELIIGNDKSPDHTDLAVEKLLSDYAGKIVVKYISRKTNVGINPNFIDLVGRAKGHFIAICEGDDYWTDPYKLQKQVNFLKANQDCNLVYHRVMVYDEDDKVLMPERLGNTDIESKRTLEELSSEGNFMHTPSVMFYNNIDYSPRLLSGVIGDYVLWFLNGEKGKFGYIPDYMAVYRMWNGSVWGKKSLFKQSYHWLMMLEKLINYTDSKLIRRKLIAQAVTVCERIGLTDLNANERNLFIMIVLRIKPAYIFTLFKRFAKSFFKS